MSSLIGNDTVIGAPPNDLQLRSQYPLLFEIAENLAQWDIFSLDLETSGFSHEFDNITVVALASPSGKWALRVRDYPLPVIKHVLRDCFLSTKKTIVGHNIKFDLLFLRYKGIEILCRVEDTMVMSWLWREDGRSYEHGLKSCVKAELNHQMTTYQEASGLFESLTDYAADDAHWTLELRNIYVRKLKTTGVWKWFSDVETHITSILCDIEYRGVQLDQPRLVALKKEAFDQLEALEVRIYQLAGRKFDVASPQQCAQVLFAEKKIGVKPDGSNSYSERGKNGEYSTANAVLEAIALDYKKLPRDQQAGDPRALGSALLDYREVNTRLNVFIRPLLERCQLSTIIHPSYSQIGTVTGRFASRDPNFQNLPRDGGIRAAFIAREGFVYVRADYSQAELRLMAHMSQDPTMLEVYRNNGDIHTATAAACGLQGDEGRQAAKAINFGLIYRMNASRLQGQLALKGITITYDQAVAYIKRYFSKYFKVRDYHSLVEKTIFQRLEQDKEFGWVRTLGGRYRHLEKVYLEDRKLSYSAITQGINATIQGGVSDLVKVAMIEIQNEFKARGWLNAVLGVWRAYIIGQIHDEIIVECEKDISAEVKQIVKAKMEEAGVFFKLSVPMTADAKIAISMAK